jgi:hypothetical protein
MVMYGATGTEHVAAILPAVAVTVPDREIAAIGFVLKKPGSMMICFK